MLEGEKQALLKQVMIHIDATKRRLRALGLNYVEVGLFDERTKQPIGDHQYLIDMAEGKEPPEVIAAREQAKADAKKAEQYRLRAEQGGSEVE